MRGQFSRAEKNLTPGDGWNDADLIAFLHGSGFFFEEADVLVVDEDIHEATNISVFVADALEEAGVGGIQICENLADVCARGGNDFLLIGELAEWGWDADLDRHGEEF
jgi:hypothetical protein